MKDTVVWSSGEEQAVNHVIDSHMIECRGCGTASLRCIDSYPDIGESEIEYFPPRVSRRLPPWFTQVSDSRVRSMTTEVYTALHANSRQLAMMGARAVIDLVLLDRVGDVGTFGEKLDALARQGYVSPRNREYLEAALEAGHAATHRGHAPSVKDINLAMDIIENLLQAVYVLKDAAAKLNKTTPKRR